MKRLVVLLAVMSLAGVATAQDDLRSRMRKLGYDDKAIEELMRDLSTLQENRNLRVPRYGDRYKLYDDDGEYRGTLNRNRRDSESVANPNSTYGRRFERDRQRSRLRVYDEDDQILRRNRRDDPLSPNRSRNRTPRASDW